MGEETGLRAVERELISLKEMVGNQMERLERHEQLLERLQRDLTREITALFRNGPISRLELGLAEVRGRADAIEESLRACQSRCEREQEEQEAQVRRVEVGQLQLAKRVAELAARLAVFSAAAWYVLQHWL